MNSLVVEKTKSKQFEKELVESSTLEGEVKSVLIEFQKQSVSGEQFYQESFSEAEQAILNIIDVAIKNERARCLECAPKSVELQYCETNDDLNYRDGYEQAIADYQKAINGEGCNVRQDNKIYSSNINGYFR